MRQLFQKIFAVSFRDWLFFVKAFMLCLFLRVAFLVGSFKGTMRLLSALGEKNKRSYKERDLAMFKRMIAWSYHFTPVLNCLSISAAYRWLLMRRGIVTELKFGVAKEGGKLIAHAWLEHEGMLFSHETHPKRRYIAFEKPIL